MKKLCLIIIFTIISFHFYGQTVLTNGMVYNYMVGDTFQYVNTPNFSIPPRYYTQVVTQKITKTDTIIYQFQEDYYIPPSCMSCSASAGTNSYSFQITNLNANASHFSPTNTSSCTTQSDTSYISNCGKIINNRFNTTTSSCFEPTMYSSYLHEGVGLYYSYTIYNSLPPGAGYSISLMYYHKVGEPPCGINGMPLVVEENSNWVSVSIFPNPVTNKKISIKNTNAENLVITITAIDGREVSKFNLMNADSELNLKIESGLYFVKIQNNNSGEFITQKIIVE